MSIVVPPAFFRFDSCWPSLSSVSQCEKKQKRGNVVVAIRLLTNSGILRVAWLYLVQGFQENKKELLGVCLCLSLFFPSWLSSSPSPSLLPSLAKEPKTKNPESLKRHGLETANKLTLLRRGKVRSSSNRLILDRSYPQKERAREIKTEK